MYKTARAVKWLAKNIDEDITDINNGKLLHRMTFAKAPNMNVKDVVKLAEKVNPGLESTVIEENTEPHVFYPSVHLLLMKLTEEISQKYSRN